MSGVPGCRKEEADAAATAAGGSRSKAGFYGARFGTRCSSAFPGIAFRNVSSEEHGDLLGGIGAEFNAMFTLGL
jgi:hypothetical protein